MKYILISFCLFILIFSSSCTKEESLNNDDGLIKTIDSIVMDPHIGSIPLENDNFLVVSDGQMIKLNNTGEVQWKKNVSPHILNLRNVITIPGNRFAAIGFGDNATMFVCVFDSEGNFLSSKGVIINQPPTYGVGITEFIRLTNGNYAICYYSFFANCSYLKILDPDFNLLHTRAYCEPPNYYSFTIQRISETPDGGVAITASIGSGGIEDNYINTEVIIAGADGIAKSYTILNDSLINEIPSAVAAYSNGFFTVTSKMSGWETGNGAFVDYYGLTSIAGQISINRFNTDGQFIDRLDLNDYPGYGVINSIRKTTDGGFMLCGTVNNLGTSIAVSRTKIYLLKLDSNLNKQWSRVIQTSFETIGVDAVPASDGGYLVTGNVKSLDEYNKMLLIKTNADGHY